MLWISVRSQHNQIGLFGDRVIDDRRVWVSGLRDGRCIRRQRREIEGTTHFFQHPFARQRSDDSRRLTDIASHRHRLESRQDVQRRQLRVVPARESRRMGERANG